MTPEQHESLQASVFRNTGNDPMWLGFWIKRYVEAEALSTLDAANELGLSLDSLALFCLCWSPRPDSFQEDLTVVCKRTGAKIEAAARIIRQEQAMMRWRETANAGEPGWMLAASDADESSPSAIEEEDSQGEMRPG
jgi:hypothetical protein